MRGGQHRIGRSGASGRIPLRGRGPEHRRDAGRLPTPVLVRGASLARRHTIRRRRTGHRLLAAADTQLSRLANPGCVR
ncbi:protein of unknown function [Agreia sp. COWG]|nr:protein of unknown function [Agreia sp. COWG]